MKILIYGAGVIGSVFAGKLALAGNDVSVLARGKRFEEIKNNGVILVNPKTQKVEQAKVSVIDTLVSKVQYDYIIVVMQKTQVDSILSSLSQNCSKNIVFVVNTASGYDKWAAAVGEERLMLGFPAAGGERKDGKVNYFIGKGVQRAFQTTTFGEYSGEKTNRVKTLIKLFNQAKIPSVFCSDIDTWQKTHVALVTNIANALYGYDCNNFKLGCSCKAVKLMIKGIQEGRKVLRKNGINPTPKKLLWLDLPVPILALSLSIFMRTTLAETTMAKHCISAKPEMIMLQQEFDELIMKSGINTPVIDNLKKNLLKGSDIMPQMNKGGKFIFGKSLVREDLSVHLPEQAISEYDITSEKKVYLISGSKKTGGFVVTRKGLLYPSKIGNILKDTPELYEYELKQGQFVKYKGRLYCWVHISEDGIIQLTKDMIKILDISIGMELLSIRSSDIAFTMGAKGPLLEKADNFDGHLEIY